MSAEERETISGGDEGAAIIIMLGSPAEGPAAEAASKPGGGPNPGGNDMIRSCFLVVL